MLKTNHPIAVLFATAMFALLWVPTLAMPAKASVPATLHGSELA